MGDFCTCSLRLNQLITPVWKHFPHLETSGNLHFTMATITLRQEGGSHNFQERQITVESDGWQKLRVQETTPGKYFGHWLINPYPPLTALLSKGSLFTDL